jgi:hypothetical protein
MERIRIAPGSEDNAMAGMLENLLSQNIAQSKIKEAIFNAMKTVVAIHIEDIDVALTLEFAYGTLTIYSGTPKRPRITIRTESAYVLDLSNISIRFGLPNFFDDKGKEIVKNIVAGKIKLIAAPWDLLDVIRLTRVMSVNE